MTTQVIFKIDKKLKKRAMREAKNKGIALSDVLKMATKAFADGELNVGLVREEKFNAKTRKEIESALRDIKAGRNLSPSFDNAKDAINYLKNLK